MRIAVVGGTGTAGRLVAAELVRRGHDVLTLSRTAPDPPVSGATHRRIDLLTGEGLDEALAGAEVVVDAANGPPSKAARPVLVDGTRRVLETPGERHHVLLSIVGIERVPTTYYEIKVAQEALVEASPAPWTIVRATQFHALLASGFGVLAKARLIPSATFPLQPVDPAEVARLVADVAEGAPRRARVEIAGPEIAPAGAFATQFKEARDRRALKLRLPFPGEVGRALKAGALTSPDAEHRGRVTFAEWLRA